MPMCLTPCREQATAQLKATRAEPEQTRQMMAVLQRLHDQQQAEGGLGADHSSTDGSSNSSDSDEEGPDNSTAYGPPTGPALKQLLKRVSCWLGSPCSWQKTNFMALCANQYEFDACKQRTLRTCLLH